MVRMPSFSGVPDATANPVVVVCEYANGACGPIVAYFTMGSGTGNESIAYHSDLSSDPDDIDAVIDNGHYHLRWHTDRCLEGACTLDPAKTYRLRVLSGAIELGHADLDVVATAKELRNVNTNEYIPLKDGRTLVARFRVEVGAVQKLTAGQPVSVGSQGGQLTAEDGSVALEIPAGAITGTVQITTEPTTDVPSTGEFATPVELGPDGQTFAQPLLLSLGFDPTKLPSGVPTDALRVVTWVDDHWEEVPGSTLDPIENTISAPITHFSYYGLQIAPNLIQGNPGPNTLYIGQTTTITGLVLYYQTSNQQQCYWNRGWHCYYPVVATYPIDNYRITWRSTTPGVASVDVPGYSISALNGGITSPPIRALAPGNTLIIAGTGAIDYSGISLTVLPSMVFDVAGSGTLSTRRIGLGQGVSMNVRIPSPAASNVTVNFTHSNPAVAGSNPSLVINAGSTSQGTAVGASGVGRDTVIGTAGGYGPDSLFVEVAQGRIRVTGLPSTLVVGDSAPIRILPMNPDSAYNDGAWNTSFGLGTSTKLTFSLNSQAVTSIAVPDGSPATPQFYVKARQPGTATLTVTNPWYITGPYQITTNLPAVGGGARGYVYSAVDDAGQSDLYYVNSDGTGIRRMTNDGGSDYAPSVSPDGQYVAWQGGGGPNIRVMPVGGGAALTIASCGYNHHPTWSPDGQFVAYNSNCFGGNGDVLISHADGTGTATKVTTTPAGGGTGFPAWSPDGRRMAYMMTTGANGYQLYVTDLATRVPTQLTTGFSSGGELSWSPNGREIAYTCGFDLCTVDYLTLVNRQLTTGGHRDANPAWSPDGTTILFARIEDLWVINANGTGARQITRGPAAGEPDWVRVSAPVLPLVAADGYVYSGVDGAGQSDLYYVNTDGTGLLRITNDGASDFAPSVSYDGQYVAWQTVGGPNIKVMPLAGGPGINIATCGYNHHPSWSPDGQLVAYNSNCLGGNGDILVVRSDGAGTAVRLTTTPAGGGSGFPAWSPDGQRIAYMMTTGVNGYQLFVVDVATREATKLTTGNSSGSEPGWSPDGGSIVYTCGFDLCVIDYMTKANRNLTTGGHQDGNPEWSPDGTIILFNRNASIWAINPDGSAARQLSPPGPAKGETSWVRRAP